MATNKHENEFKLVSEFKGYVNKRDITNLPAGFMVSGSQNVLTTDGDRVAIRRGYELDGAEATTVSPIRSSYEWQSHRGVEHALRRSSTILELRYKGEWLELMSGLSTTAITQFTDVWVETEKQDILLFVDGDSNIYDWSGGVAVLASATSNTVTLDTAATGFATWAESGFLTAGTRTITINGVTATYTGGESTATLTGVSVDLSAQPAGSVVLQAVRTNSNKPASGLKNNLIAVLDNHVYVGQTDSRTVYVSKNNNFTDFTFSAVRLPGEGALLTFDGAVVGFVPQEEEMYISAGKDYWYKTVLTLSSDHTKEDLSVKRLKTTGQKAARSQAYISNDGNRVVFISNEPTFDQLGRVENIDTPQNRPISDPIKSDFDRYDFSVDGHVIRHKNFQYIAIPAESLVLVYNLEKGYWEAPQILPIRRFAVIDGELYGHSSVVAETYKLFTGTNDNGNPINARAVFSYQNFGDRAKKKSFTEYYTEGYISSNTNLNCIISYDYGGYNGISEYVISGVDDSILAEAPTNDSLGHDSLGETSLGLGGGDEVPLPPKFRVIQGVVRTDFWETQVEYNSDDMDQVWEILAFGPRVVMSTSGNNEIIK